MSEKNMFSNFIQQSFISLCFLTCFTNCIDDPPYSQPKVRVGNTEIVGSFKRESNFLYETFLGIPYAKPPVGELRFEDPQPYKMTEDQFSATKYGNLCIQYSHWNYQIRGSEDCLYLNIFRPHITIDEYTPLLDVIFFIHGGGFMFGGPASSKKLLRRNLIFVNFTYRLGPIGFMSTGDGVLPGNLGLKDQVVALKWVNDNIRYFHGDPQTITIAGLSAGSAAVNLHLMSPLSKNLFNKAIMCSGSALNPWAMAKKVPEKTRQVAKALQCPTDDSHDLLKCLKTKKADDIVAQVPKFMKFLYVPFTPFGPVVESTISSGAFLTDHPYELMRSGQVTKVPVIIGMVTGEGLYPTAEFLENQIILQQLDSDWTNMASYLLDFHYTLDENSLKQNMQAIREQYLHQESVTNAKQRLVQMVGDRLFGSGIAQGALLYASVSNKQVYMYRFGYSGSRSSTSILNMTKNEAFGVSHGDDCLLYVFDTSGFKIDSISPEEDLNMSDMMIRMWSEFASNRVPQLAEQQSMTDARSGLPNLKYMEIESPSRIYENSTGNMANMRFWRQFLLKENPVYEESLTKGPGSGSSVEKFNSFLIIIYVFVPLLIVGKCFLR